jgi:2-polyprenyl-6-methoxyphenol hydroxylase-like FAD-dependent oxidoreductase
MFVEHEHGLDRFHMVLADGYQVVLLPLSTNRFVVGLTERSITYHEMIQRGEEFVKKRIGDVVPSLSSAIEGSDAKFSDESLLVIQPEESWAKTYTIDGGVLIGDAAHSFHPGAGQGAQQAFLDAIALAPVIQKRLSSGDFSRESLMEFERPRQALIRFWKSNSRRMISMQTAQGSFQRWLRNRYMRKAGEISGRKDVQEILWGLRTPTRMELIRLALSLFL